MLCMVSSPAPYLATRALPCLPSQESLTSTHDYGAKAENRKRRFGLAEEEAGPGKGSGRDSRGGGSDRWAHDRFNEEEDKGSRGHKRR